MSKPAQRISILIVDDHALFRQSIARLLEREPDLDVVGHVGSIEEGLAVVRERQVDLVLLDFDLGRQDGLDFMQHWGERGASPKILIVTAGIEPHQTVALIRAGALGVFLKRDSAELLTQSIRDVMAGKVSFDQELLRRAISEAAPPAVAAGEPTFTSRERQVLSYVFEGLANKEIAGRIGVSESSVKATLQQLFGKTGVRTRSQLVRITLERYKHEI